jgi:transposase
MKLFADCNFRPLWIRVWKKRKRQTEPYLYKKGREGKLVYGSMTQTEARKGTMHSLERREEALALHRDGLGCKKIAKRMELSVDAVKGLIRRYGERRCDWSSTRIFVEERTREEKSDRSSTRALVGEETREEKSVSMEFIPLAEMEAHRIFLVCGPYDFRGKIDGFVAKVPEALGENIAVGDILVFCKRSRYQISVLQWQGDGFGIMFRRTEGERYPWPVSAQFKVIEVSRKDLQTLLEYPQFVRRLSGLATPESYL